MSGWGKFLDRNSNPASRILVVALALSCLAGMAHVVSIIGLRVPLDPNEGWNAYRALAAMSGAPLYPDAHGFMANNYPPLSFYIVGGLGKILGDYIVAGRILSLLALFAVALGTGVLARRMGASRLQAAFAALFFVATMLIFTGYVGMNDPQLLGHAVAIAGLLFLIGTPRTIRAIMAGALLLTLAGFIKHNLVAAPLAVTLWFALYDRRAAMRFVLCGIFFALLGLMTCGFLFGANFLSHIDSARSYSLDALLAGASSWLIWRAVPLAGLAALTWRNSADKDVMFVTLYLAISIALGAIFIGGAGVDVNAFFDADIALALGCGLALDRFSRHRPLYGAAFASACFASLAAGLFLATDSDWRDLDYWRHPMAEDAAVADADIAFLRAREGPALCESLSLCYGAGKPPAVDVFNVGQEFLKGTRKDDALIRLIGAHYFRVLQFDTLAPFALGPRVLRAIGCFYAMDHTDDDGVFFVPRAPKK